MFQMFKNAGSLNQVCKVGSSVTTSASNVDMMTFINKLGNSIMTILSNSSDHGVVTIRDSAGTSKIIMHTSGNSFINTSSGLGVGSSTLDASAILTVTGTTKGLLFPRMTTTQKNAISSPTAGLVVYDTSLNKLCVFTTVWETITSV